MNARKEVTIEVNVLERRFLQERAKVREYKHSLESILSDNKMVLIAMLFIPTVALIWTGIKKGDLGVRAKRLVRWGMLTAVSSLKKQIV